jgi:hypothetical protein
MAVSFVAATTMAKEMEQLLRRLLMVFVLKVTIVMTTVMESSLSVIRMVK